MTASYCVGIDLGTTNIVMAYAPTASPDQIAVFPIPQLLAPGQVGALPQLPACRYHYGKEVEPSQTGLPWQQGPVGSGLPNAVIGSWAQELGRHNPQRLVHSAKSWLAFDQSSDNRLPWRADDEVDTITAVDASASFLEYLRLAWDSAHPNAPLADQHLVLTVPASFDDLARTLTVEAARKAGLSNLLLMEEPLAACYNWLRQPDAEACLARHKSMLVCDIGGGTSDFSLISIDSKPSPPRLKRTGVGEHLMLGGDNMDLALAAQVQRKLGSTGASRQVLQSLLQQTRPAKETLLGDDAPEEVAIVQVGRGSSLMAQVQRTRLTRAETEQLVLDGFFPLVSADCSLVRRNAALREMGLPYPADPAITRHLAQFLREHDANHSDQLPDLLLLNGNPFNSPLLTTRLSQQLQQWQARPLTTIQVDEPGFAVAKGAAYYCVQRYAAEDRRQTIESGNARNYFVVAEGAQGKQAICVLPRGTAENQALELASPSFTLQCGKPVQFELVSRSDGQTFALGDSTAITPEFHHLPKLATTLEGDGQIQIRLTACLTELGLLALTCRSVETDTQWPLEFNLRRHEKAPAALPDSAIQQRAMSVVNQWFGSATQQSSAASGSLRKQLEKATRQREWWGAADARGIADKLILPMSKRRRSKQHERGWFNLVGYCMRPGFGLPGDSDRIAKLWPLYQHGLQFQTDEQSWREWWIFWRRIAAGLNENQQSSVLDEIGMVLVPGFARAAGSRPRQRFAIDERIRLIGALERIPVETKQQVGEMLLTLIEKQQHIAASAWALARIGARRPAYAAVDTRVATAATEDWLRRLLILDWKAHPELCFTAASLAHCVSDQQTLPAELIQQISLKLKQAKSSVRWLNWLSSSDMQQDSERYIWGDTLPAGLRLAD